ncbi:hypothetical protein V8E36_004320 [Tilletia maclaganii]
MNAAFQATIDLIPSSPTLTNLGSRAFSGWGALAAIITPSTPQLHSSSSADDTLPTGTALASTVRDSAVQEITADQPVAAAEVAKNEKGLFSTLLTRMRSHSCSHPNLTVRDLPWTSSPVLQAQLPIQALPRSKSYTTSLCDDRHDSPRPSARLASRRQGTLEQSPSIAAASGTGRPDSSDAESMFTSSPSLMSLPELPTRRGGTPLSASALANRDVSKLTTAQSDKVSNSETCPADSLLRPSSSRTSILASASRAMTHSPRLGVLAPVHENDDVEGNFMLPPPRTRSTTMRSTNSAKRSVAAGTSPTKAQSRPSRARSSSLTANGPMGVLGLLERKFDAKGQTSQEQPGAAGGSLPPVCPPSPQKRGTTTALSTVMATCLDNLDVHAVEYNHLQQQQQLQRNDIHFGNPFVVPVGGTLPVSSSVRSVQSLFGATPASDGAFGQLGSSGGIPTSATMPDLSAIFASESLPVLMFPRVRTVSSCSNKGPDPQEQRQQQHRGQERAFRRGMSVSAHSPLLPVSNSGVIELQPSAAFYGHPATAAVVTPGLHRTSWIRNQTQSFSASTAPSGRQTQGSGGFFGTSTSSSSSFGSSSTLGRGQGQNCTRTLASHHQHQHQLQPRLDPIFNTARTHEATGSGGAGFSSAQRSSKIGASAGLMSPPPPSAVSTLGASSSGGPRRANSLPRGYVPQYKEFREPVPASALGGSPRINVHSPLATAGAQQPIPFSRQHSGLKSPSQSSLMLTPTDNGSTPDGSRRGRRAAAAGQLGAHARSQTVGGWNSGHLPIYALSHASPERVVMPLSTFPRGDAESLPTMRTGTGKKRNQLLHPIDTGLANRPRSRGGGGGGGSSSSFSSTSPFSLSPSQLLKRPSTAGTNTTTSSSDDLASSPASSILDVPPLSAGSSASSHSASSAASGRSCSSSSTTSLALPLLDERVFGSKAKLLDSGLGSVALPVPLISSYGIVVPQSSKAQILKGTRNVKVGSDGAAVQFIGRSPKLQHASGFASPTLGSVSGTSAAAAERERRQSLAYVRAREPFPLESMAGSALLEPAARSHTARLVSPGKKASSRDRHAASAVDDPDRPPKGHTQHERQNSFSSSLSFFAWPMRTSSSSIVTRSDKQPSNFSLYPSSTSSTSTMAAAAGAAPSLSSSSSSYRAAGAGGGLPGSFEQDGARRRSHEPSDDDDYEDEEEAAGEFGWNSYVSMQDVHSPIIERAPAFSSVNANVRPSLTRSQKRASVPVL